MGYFESELQSLLQRVPHVGTTDAQLTSLEMFLGQTLPARLREFLRLAGSTEYGLLGHFHISCEGIRDIQAPFNDVVSSGLILATGQPPYVDEGFIQPRFALCQDCSDV